MSVLQVDTRSGPRRGPAAPRVHDIQRARDDAAALCSCTATSIPTPSGEVEVLRVDGEVDLLTVATLQDALTSGLARGPCHLLVDLAELTFCSVRGLSLLVEAGRTAAGQGTGYAPLPRSARGTWRPRTPRHGRRRGPCRAARSSTGAGLRPGSGVRS